MSGTLTLSSKLSPFPYGILAIAICSETIQIVYDEATTQPILEFKGSKIENEDEIIHALATAAGLAEGSPSVCTISDTVERKVHH
jgi:glutamyl-tRNA synthetase